MDNASRKRFNASFTPEKYRSFLMDIHQQFDHVPNFRIAETPVFIDQDLQRKLIEACDLICSEIMKPSFKDLTAGSLDDTFRVPNEDDHTQFLQLDFGITRDVDGTLVPRLIETQGFPTLYFYQDMVARMYRQHFDVPQNCHHLLNCTSDEYLDLLREMIVGQCDPENVVLLEIEPDKQPTRIDFLITERILGIKILCISNLKRDGRSLYYVNDFGKKVPIYRIYNRVIFDDLIKRVDLQHELFFTEEIDAEWVGHPNWFFRISKYALPLFDNKYVPNTWYLKDLTVLPEDLHNYVLKPMFSFSGSGVMFNLSGEAIQERGDLRNFILQEKISYEPVVESLGEPAKCEVRMLLLWPKDVQSPIIVNSLVRLSKGDMIGVKYNYDQAWVGGSVGFFVG